MRCHHHIICGSPERSLLLTLRPFLASEVKKAQQAMLAVSAVHDLVSQPCNSTLCVQVLIVFRAYRRSSSHQEKTSAISSNRNGTLPLQLRSADRVRSNITILHISRPLHSYGAELMMNDSHLLIHTIRAWSVLRPRALILRTACRDRMWIWDELGGVTNIRGRIMFQLYHYGGLTRFSLRLAEAELVYTRICRYSPQNSRHACE